MDTTEGINEFNTCLPFGKSCGLKKVMETKESIDVEIENYKKIGLFKKPKNQLLNFLDLTPDEKVLINLRLFPLKNIFISNVRESYAKRLILTTERIIFIRENVILS